MTDTTNQVVDAAMASKAVTAHASAQRLDTRTVMTRALKNIYPDLHLTATPQTSVDFLGFANAGYATATPLDPDTKLSTWEVKGASRMPGFAFFDFGFRDEPSLEKKKKGGAEITETLQYGAFSYEWRGCKFIVFTVEGMVGMACRPDVTNYILCEGSNGDKTECDEGKCKAHELMANVAEWMMQPGKAVMVFDEGRWKKDKNLWQVTQSADWDKVVLKEEKKAGLRDDVEGFFDSEELYKGFAVPWKRGTIFHGPPGNGKTLCIQSLMKSLSNRAEPIPTLYVKTFVAERGPQWSVSQIFSRARATAPCLLVFEDIDSMVTEKLRSYFLNEVDGLESNSGIYMLGTTNHLERLDPALANRPSRFDRKVQFEVPSHFERVEYAKQWRSKVASISDDEFSDELCAAVADITDGFSFAYLKELFLATLLGIARENSAVSNGTTEALVHADQDGNDPAEESHPELGKTIMWPKIRAQVQILRAAMKSAESKEKKKVKKNDQSDESDDDPFY